MTDGLSSGNQPTSEGSHVLMTRVVSLLERGDKDKAIEILDGRLKRHPKDNDARTLRDRIRLERQREEAALPPLARKVAQSRRAKPMRHGRLSGAPVMLAARRQVMLKSLGPEIKSAIRHASKGSLILFLLDFGLYGESGEHIAVASIPPDRTVGDLLELALNKLRPQRHDGISGFFERRRIANRGFDLKDWDSRDGWHVRVQCTESPKDDVELTPLSSPLNETGLKTGDIIKLYRKDWPHMSNQDADAKQQLDV
jgi:hypothetical protein